jgi:uncharacterized integral membrane protein (TIGR00698 family)
VQTTEKQPASGGTWVSFGLGLGITVVIGLVAMGLALLPGLAVMGALTIALLLGLLWRATLGLPKAYAGGVRFSAQKLLRYGIILTGVRLNFTLLASGGIRIFLQDLALILLALLLFPWLAHKLGLSKRLAFLMSVGQAICGASAVGAMAAALPDSEDDDVSLAVAICGLVGTLGVLAFVFGEQIFHLSAQAYGLLSGSILHEIAQVVAAGPAAGPAGADIALVTKLTRVVLLAPIAIIVAFGYAWKQGGKGTRMSWKKLPIPWFVLGFLVVGVITSFGVFSRPVIDGVLQVSTFLMVASMAAMGLQVDLKVIRTTGLKAVGVAVLLFAILLMASAALTFAFV